MATNRVYEWVDERTGIKPALDYVLYRRIPKSVDWLFTLGSATLTVFLIQAVSGIFLAMGYTPSDAPVAIAVNGNPLTTSTGQPLYSSEALESVRNITSNLGIWGYAIRGFHHWGANVMVVVIFLHMLHSFFCGSYKYPREMTWFVGVFLLLFVLGFSFTGYLLPWDNRAYWATQVGINIGGAAPVLGPAVGEILRGGATLGAATLSRFYAIHVLILPSLTGLFIALHLFLIVKIGISGSPRFREQVSGEFFDSVGSGGKKGGRAFFPYTIVEDAIVSALVVAIIVALTIIFPAGNTGPADPTNGVDTVSGGKFDPRPEWYFLFLFQFLKIVPSINVGPINLPSAAIGGVIIPTILVLLLFFAPVLDRSPKRHPFNRPIASTIMLLAVIGIVALTVVAFATNEGDVNPLTNKPVDIEAAWHDAKVQPLVTSIQIANNGSGGAAASSGQTSNNTSSGGSSTTAAAGGSSGTTAASGGSGASAADIQAGLQLFQSNGCSGCHSQNGQAAGVGPKLQGDANITSADFVVQQVRNKAVAPMPKYPASQLSDADLNKIAAYVLSLQGKK